MTQQLQSLAQPAPNPLAVSPSSEGPLVLVVGNPNVGKTTVFNALTGQSARVGNYPGVTVERRVGSLLQPGGDERAVIVDVPGAYSLCARSAEEQIAINAVLGLQGNPPPDLVCVVLDAGQLARNSYLLLQLIELQVPLLVVLNMIDEVSERPPRAEALGELFGVPCVATNARDGIGVERVKHAIFAALAAPRPGSVSVAYPESLRADVDAVAETLPAHWRKNVERDRALARWALCSIDRDDELDHIPPALRESVLAVQQGSLSDEAGTERQPLRRDLDHEMIGARYAFIDAHLPAVYERPAAPQRRENSTDRIDRVLLHPLLGFAIFLAIMTTLFQSLFTWAEPLIELTENAVSGTQTLLVGLLPTGVLRDALVEGVVGGVGNVIVFLPQILLLFLFVGLLEDSGYMARVAYLMDRVLRGVGLHGRAFVPMLSGFACAIPAIMATRTMERQRDRLLTMLVVPLMSCAARLPVYSLVIAALFPPTLLWGVLPLQGVLMVSIYLFSTLMSLAAAAVLGRTAVKGRRVPLILELPRYRMPKLRAVLRMSGERALDFLKEAGTVILAFTLLLWVLLSFPKADPPSNTAAPAVAASSAVAATSAAQPRSSSEHEPPTSEHPAIEQSYGGRLGKALEPALKPLGFDWKIGVGLIGAFAAREVFVSTLGLVYGLDNAADDDRSLREQIQADTLPDGRARYTPLVGLSLLVFFALACQCMSTLAVVRRETRSWRWPLFLFGYMTALAYGCSLLVFQLGSLLGF